VVIPLLKERASHLPATFQSIDQMQELINKLKQNVAEAQRRVEEAEESYATLPSVSKLFGVFSRKTPIEKPAGPLKVIDVKAEFAQMKADIKSRETAK